MAVTKRFYDQPKEKREAIVAEMKMHLQEGLLAGNSRDLQKYSGSRDTHTRKWAYINIGRLYKEQRHLGGRILAALREMMLSTNERIRQNAVYAAGEIGDLRIISDIIEKGLRDSHHSVRNAVIGALKLMGSRDPAPTIAFARKHMADSDPEVRRQVVHGIELHGRTHPQNILPLLREMQAEGNRRVQKMIMHVVSQISYKDGCLETVIEELRTWKNRNLVDGAVTSILAVHRDQSYCRYTYEEAKGYIEKNLQGTDCLEKETEAG